MQEGKGSCPRGHSVPEMESDWGRTCGLSARKHLGGEDSAASRRSCPVRTEAWPSNSRSEVTGEAFEEWSAFWKEWGGRQRCEGHATCEAAL